MLKINSVKLLIFLKSLQIFFQIAITCFVVALFIISIIINPEKILLWNSSQYDILLNVGFYNLGFLSDGTLWYQLSSSFISFVVIICLLFAGLIINSIYLWKKFYFDNNLCIDLSVCCIFATAIILFVIFLMNFIQPINIENSNSEWRSMNLLFNYSMTSNQGYSIIKTSLTSAGIAYNVIMAYLITGLIYFPVKIIYNLVKAKYI